MEERTSDSSERNELTTQGPATENAPSSPQAPSDDGAALSFSDDEEGEFEFPFVSRDSPAGTAARPADELFADGRIRPFYYYPVFFGRLSGTAATQPAAEAPPPPPRVRGQLGRLFLEESRARKRDSTDDYDGLEKLEGAPPPESYCLWTPGSSSSPRPLPPPRKSSSTGSMARWRRISDLVVGRSHSFGKEKFVFFPRAAAPTTTSKEVPSNTKHHDGKHRAANKPRPAASGFIRKKATAEVDDAHRIAYGGGGGVPGGTPRRTFLPYREELVGFFANVNGISRSHQHPF